MVRLLFSVIPILVVFVILFLVLRKRPEFLPNNTKTLKVLTYSAFLNSWGPGPFISKKFEEQTGVSVEFIDGGEAGILLKKLSLFQADVVLGLDQFAIAEKESDVKWATPFLPVDWSPMSFVYRKGEIEPPKSLDDLLDKRFEKQISISDPRTSTPGLQFLIWILQTKGREKGFAYLKALKKNIAFVGSNWSSSYGYFKKKQSQLVFSYLTSPVYHWVEDKNLSYQTALLKEKLPIQVEFAAVPSKAENKEMALKFLTFLLSDEVQKTIMQKNYMLPIRQENTAGTAFERLNVSFLKESEMTSKTNYSKAEIQQILNEWQEIGF